jgi:hypothetical protein
LFPALNGSHSAPKVAFFYGHTDGLVFQIWTITTYGHEDIVFSEEGTD